MAGILHGCSHYCFWELTWGEYVNAFWDMALSRWSGCTSGSVYKFCHHRGRRINSTLDFTLCSSVTLWQISSLIKLWDTMGTKTPAKQVQEDCRHRLYFFEILIKFISFPIYRHKSVEGMCTHPLFFCILGLLENILGFSSSHQFLPGEHWRHHHCPHGAHPLLGGMGVGVWGCYGLRFYCHALRPLWLLRLPGCSWTVVTSTVRTIHLSLRQRPTHEWTFKENQPTILNVDRMYFEYYFHGQIFHVSWRI